MLAERMQVLQLESNTLNSRNQEVIAIRAEQRIARVEQECQAKIASFENTQVHKWHEEVRQFNGVRRAEAVSERNAAHELSAEKEMLDRQNSIASAVTSQLQSKLHKAVNDEAMVLEQLRNKDAEIMYFKQHATSIMQEAHEARKVMQEFSELKHMHEESRSHFKHDVIHTPPPNVNTTVEGASPSKPKGDDPYLLETVSPQERWDWKRRERGSGTKTVTSKPVRTSTGASSSGNDPSTFRQPNGLGEWTSVGPAKSGGSGGGGDDRGMLCIHGKIPQFCMICRRKPDMFNIFEKDEDENLYGKQEIKICIHGYDIIDCRICRSNQESRCTHGNKLSECEICNFVPERCEHDALKIRCPLCNPKWDKLCKHGMAPLFCDLCWQERDEAQRKEAKEPKSKKEKKEKKRKDHDDDGDAMTTDIMEIIGTRKTRRRKRRKIKMVMTTTAVLPLIAKALAVEMRPTILSPSCFDP
jgi:hypothetical protein